MQTGVIMLEYINQRRARGHSIEEAAVEGAVLRLRPIMVTSLVATLGLLPAAMSHAIGSDSQRPFAIVIVGGLISGLLLSIFLLADAVRVGGARGRRAAHAGDSGGRVSLTGSGPRPDSLPGQFTTPLRLAAITIQ